MSRNSSNKIFGTLQIVGTNDAIIGAPGVRPALDVRGGIRVKQTADIKRLCTKTSEHRKISEYNTDEGVVIFNGLMMNNYGIARAYLDDKYVLFNNDNAILDESDWEISYESSGVGPSLLKQDNNLFKVPDANGFSNPALTNWNMIIEVDVHFLVLFDFFDIPEYKFIELRLIKNEGDIVTSNYISLLPGASGSPNTITLHDIIKCSPGDVLNLEFLSYSNGDVKIQDGSAVSYATFKVLGFEEVML